jgi:glycerophosphoryl diester phosphodiesterase
LERLWHFLSNDVTINVIANLVATGIILACAFARERLFHWLRAVANLLIFLVSGKRRVLIWNDIDLTVSNQLAEKLAERFPKVHYVVIDQPSHIHDHFMFPRIIAAVVLIDTDVSKFSADPAQRRRIQRRIVRYLMRGGGVVGTHDIVYTRVRNDELQNAFGVAVTDFQRSTTAIKYKRSQAGDSHPLSASLPDAFSLEDGEVIWGNWSQDTVVHYIHDGTPPVPLIVSRKYYDGRLVWLNSGDKGKALAASIAEPQDTFVAILTNSIKWVSKLVDPSRSLKRNIVAHRGSSLRFPENTLAAFSGAVREGADWIELDVRRTREGVYVLNHDPTIGGKAIAASTFGELMVQKPDLVRLDTVLDFAKGKVQVDVELKEYGYENEVVPFIQRHLDDRDFVITSFHDDSIREIKVRFPSVRCGLLLGRPYEEAGILTRVTELFPVTRLRRCRADFVAPHYRLLVLGFSRRVRAFGYPIWVWTVDDPIQIEKLLANRSVEAIITNDPVLGLKEALAMNVRRG